MARILKCLHGSTCERRAEYGRAHVPNTDPEPKHVRKPGLQVARYHDLGPKAPNPEP